MDNWYEFGFIEVDGEYVAAAFFRNKDSEYDEMQLQLTEEQEQLANSWIERLRALHRDQAEMIQRFITEQGSYEVTRVRYN